MFLVCYLTNPAAEFDVKSLTRLLKSLIREPSGAYIMQSNQKWQYQYALAPGEGELREKRGDELNRGVSQPRYQPYK